MDYLFDFVVIFVYICKEVVGVLEVVGNVGGGRDFL